MLFYLAKDWKYVGINKTYYIIWRYCQQLISPSSIYFNEVIAKFYCEFPMEKCYSGSYQSENLVWLNCFIEGGYVCHCKSRKSISNLNQNSVYIGRYIVITL